MDVNRSATVEMPVGGGSQRTQYVAYGLFLLTRISSAQPPTGTFMTGVLYRRYFASLVVVFLMSLKRACVVSNAVIPVIPKIMKNGDSGATDATKTKGCNVQ
jgi:hypothetical protein